jgi:hypothetical protein
MFHPPPSVVILKFCGIIRTIYSTSTKRTRSRSGRRSPLQQAECCTFRWAQLGSRPESRRRMSESANRKSRLVRANEKQEPRHKLTVARADAAQTTARRKHTPSERQRQAYLAGEAVALTYERSTEPEHLD